MNDKRVSAGITRREALKIGAGAVVGRGSTVFCQGWITSTKTFPVPYVWKF